MPAKSSSRAIPEVGFNFRMTDMQAAVGRVQLTRLAAIVAGAAAHRGASTRRDCPQIAGGEGSERARVGADKLAELLRRAVDPDIDQRAVMQRMLDAGVSTRRGVMNSHLEAPYASSEWRLPRSESAQNHGVILPMAPSMTLEQIQEVCDRLDRLCAPPSGSHCRPTAPRRRTRAAISMKGRRLTSGLSYVQRRKENRPAPSWGDGRLCRRWRANTARRQVNSGSSRR